MSGLKKLHLVGPHATAVLDYLTTRDCHKIARACPPQLRNQCSLTPAEHTASSALARSRSVVRGWRRAQLRCIAAARCFPAAAPRVRARGLRRCRRRRAYSLRRAPSHVAAGRSQYACMLSESGKFVEDVLLFRTGPNAWLVVHGGGAGHELLVSAATGRNCALIFDDDTHDLSLQGPNAVELLARVVPGIRDLPYFGHMPATLFGKPVTVLVAGSIGFLIVLALFAHVPHPMGMFTLFKESLIVASLTALGEAVVAQNHGYSLTKPVVMNFVALFFGHMVLQFGGFYDQVFPPPAIIRM